MNKIRVLCSALVLLAAFQANAAGNDPVWREVTQQRARAVDNSARQFQVDDSALRQRLREAALRRPHEPPLSITLPVDDGRLARFRLYEAPIMEPALAERYPDIKTYKLYGIDDPGASGRLDITSRGMHAMLNTEHGRVFIDPDSASAQEGQYALRSRAGNTGPGHSCSVHEFETAAASQTTAARALARTSGKLKQYRIAVSATAEYVDAVSVGSPEVAQAQTAIVTAINRVTEIYERDLGISLVLVAGNDRLIESGGNVSFSDGNPSLMFVENQAWVDATIGRTNYDIGHVFGTAGGGLAFLGSTCDNLHKAKGVSAVPNPRGDPFYIDFVAHEIGHQFNAEHSFNGTSASCRNGRSAISAFEPGSGSSIMSYAGICGAENLQVNSDATFHSGSIAQIDSFTASPGSCFALVDTPEAPVSSTNLGTISARTIPANTAFELEVPASPGDDTMMYQWDQVDAGCPTDAGSFGTDIGSNALFRSHLPRKAAMRHFPALGTQLQGKFDKAEVIPCNNRDLDFRLTARGNFSGADRADVRISVRRTGATFRITNLDSPTTIDTSQPGFNVKWNVAGTGQDPINCSNVDIDLLTFAPGYSSYSVHPLATRSNSGLEMVSITPVENSHPRARIRVKCSDNVFYDISDADLTIVGSSANPADVFADDAIPVYGARNPLLLVDAAPACGVPVTCRIDSVDRSSSGGGGGSAYHWLLWGYGLLLLRRRARSQG